MISKVKKTYRKVISRGSFCCACAKWVCTSKFRTSSNLLQQQRMAEVPEINALRRNHDDIVGAMSHDLDYFKRVFVQAGFIRSSNASGIMGLLGVSASEKAGQLLESLLTQISQSTPQETRKQKFHKFVEMLMREASTEDVNRILHSYGMWEGLEKQFVVSHDFSDDIFT